MSAVWSLTARSGSRCQEEILSSSAGTSRLRLLLAWRNRFLPSHLLLPVNTHLVLCLNLLGPTLGHTPRLSWWSLKKAGYRGERSGLASAQRPWEGGQRERLCQEIPWSPWSCSSLHSWHAIPPSRHLSPTAPGSHSHFKSSRMPQWLPHLQL